MKIYCKSFFEYLVANDIIEVSLSITKGSSGAGGYLGVKGFSNSFISISIGKKAWKIAFDKLKKTTKAWFL